MAHKSHSSAEQRRSKLRLQTQFEHLEKREVLAPFVSTQQYTTTFTAAETPSFTFLGTVDVTQAPYDQSATGFTSVTQLTPSSEFGGDIVRIQGGPGGDFGKGVYAISRGGGENAAAVNRPGVVYRVDPTTGKASTFFDLNDLIQKLQNNPAADASSVVTRASGLVNWYDIAFDPEGYFFGRSAMLISMADSTDASKNRVYAIGSDGSLIGVLATFNEQSTINQLFTRTPTSIVVPPVEQQARVRGLFSGTGTQNADGEYVAIYFDANVYRPGQDLNKSVLPPGVSLTNLDLGPQVGLTSSNNLVGYSEQIFSVFTDLTARSAGGLPGVPGFSGIQGNAAGLFITPNPAPGTNIPFEQINLDTIFEPPTSTVIDTYSLAQTPFRRFEDIAFDYFGYFSYGSLVDPTTGTTDAPSYVGSMFVTDLATGMATSGTVTIGGVAYNFYAPVNGPGSVGIDPSSMGTGNPADYRFRNNGTSMTGGRVLRVAPDGTVTPFAEGFNVSTSWDQTSFEDSSLSITFSADGTKMWVSDNDGIWQFATTLSLAGSTTGNIIGLNDLRTFGVPYQGQNSAVAVLDTGVDGDNTAFRGRVARGTNINRRRNSPGNIDTAGVATSGATAGHGTPVAGIVSQMVPDATILPVNLFVTGAAAGPITAGSLGYTSNQAIFKALQYVGRNPYVQDPIRPGQKDRVIGTTMAWGTQTSFPTEGQAFAAYPQIVASFKQQLLRIRKMGIASVGAAGQFGVPQGDDTTTAFTTGDWNGMSMPAVLNEVVSVGMTSPLPFYLTPNTEPTDPDVGPNTRAFIPIQFRGTDGTDGGIGTGEVLTMTTGQANLYGDDILFSSNASITLDYMAPGIDVPTFAQTSTANNPLVFDQAGTSMSTAVAQGSFAIVSSAINYWVNMNKNGATSDAYLTQPVGATALNFGQHPFKDLSTYANPDGVNSILQWTAVPVYYDEMNSFTDVDLPQTGLAYSRVDVGNAVAAIEGQVAIQYLLNNGTFSVIDSNKNGMLTAAEIQNFVDNAAAMGMAEAGAMARFLGGISTFKAGATEYSVLDTASGIQGVLSTTSLDDVPDPAGALSRRFNFFDYASDGQLNGFVTLDQLKLLAHTLLPSPSSFTIIDRTRSSANAYLLDPEALRNYNEITKLNYNWVYASRTQWQSALKKFNGFSPAQYGVNAGLNDRTDPQYILFQGPIKRQVQAKKKDTSPTTTAETGGKTTTPAPVTTGTDDGGDTTGGNKTADNSAALLEALKTLVQNNPTNTGTSKTTEETPKAASGMNRKVVPVATPTNVARNVARPAQKTSTSLFKQLADKTGLGNLF
jgi:hypothetical protein